MSLQLNVIKTQNRLTSRWEIVKYQLITYCYLHGIQLTESETNCIAHLAIKGEQSLSDFCNSAAQQEKIFKSSQTVRNCISKMEKSGLILSDDKKGYNRKIRVNPDIKLNTEGNILVEVKLYYVES